MISAVKLQELSDAMKKQYSEKILTGSDIIVILLGFRGANLIAAPTVRIIAEEIINKDEVESALVEAILISKNKKLMRSLVNKAKEEYGL